MTARDGSGLRKRQAGFAAIPNATVFDAGLSARALGVLVKVVALPEDWDLRMDWLVRQFPEGREAITTAVRELRKLGFYRVERRRRDDGTFTSGVSISDAPLPEWIAQHATACREQGTDRPKWDVSLRVLPDGRVEDEPRLAIPGTESDDANTGTADGKPVSGQPVSGKPVTGLPDVKERNTTQTINSLPTGESTPANGGSDCPPVDDTAQMPLVDAPARPVKTKRKVGVPDNWQPDEALCGWTSRTAPGMPRSEIEAFVAYHQAHGNTFVRLDRAWQTWVNRWVERSSRRGPGATRPGPYRNTGWQNGTSQASWEQFMETGGPDDQQ